MSTRTLAKQLHHLVHQDDPCESIKEIRDLADQILEKLSYQNKLNPTSDKRKNQLQEYSKQRKRYLASHPRCQVDGCNQVAVEIHHKQKRDGDRLLNESLWMPVCKGCHRQITVNPQWAYEMGYLLKINAV